MLINFNYITRYLTILVSLSALIFMVMCSTLQNLANIQNPVTHIERVQVSQLNFESLTLDFDIGVDNPNPLAINLDGFSYDFQLNESSFLKGTQEKDIQIAANGKSTFTIPLLLNYTDIYQSYQKLQNQDSTFYELKMELGFILPLMGRVNIPLSRKGFFPLLKLPTLQIESLKLKNFNLTKADLELRLNLINPNHMGFVVNLIDYEFQVNEKSWIISKSDTPQKIASKQSNLIHLPITLNLSQLGTTVYNLFSGNNNLSYHFDGSFILDGDTPLLQAVRLNFDKTGNVLLEK